MVVKVKEESTTLFDYFKKNIEKNVTDHVIKVAPLLNGLIEIRLHSANGESETPTFFVKDNQVARTVEELISMLKS